MYSLSYRLLTFVVSEWPTKSLTLEMSCGRIFKSYSMSISRYMATFSASEARLMYAQIEVEKYLADLKPSPEVEAIKMKTIDDIVNFNTTSWKNAKPAPAHTQQAKYVHAGNSSTLWLIVHLP